MQTLVRQGLFLKGEEALIFSVPAADPRGWTGPKVPSGFPGNESRSLAPLRWETSGKLVPWDGPIVSLGGTRDFFRASIRFLETLPPSPLGLSGIHRQAVLEPPLSLGAKVRAASHSHLGPLVQLATGSRLAQGSSLSPYPGAHPNQIQQRPRPRGQNCCRRFRRRTDEGGGHPPSLSSLGEGGYHR